MNDRQRLWRVAHDLIEGLGPHFVVPLFGNVKNQALTVAYENIMGYPNKPPKLTDNEISMILKNVTEGLNAA